jgi:G3E family GTPase
MSIIHTSAFVITGFLGSGKTTLIINSVREHLSDKRVAVIVNEFGDVGLDGKILRNVYSEVMEISEGCICCKLSQEFESAVSELIRDYAPEVIIVETSGTSEPFPIMFSLKTIGCDLDGVICVVDSKNFDKYKEEDTAKYQLASSNVVVLNKIDLVDEERLRELEEEVKRIKSAYRLRNMFSQEESKQVYVIYRAERGRIPREVFLGTGSPLTIMERAEHGEGHGLYQRVVKLKRALSYEELENLLSSLGDSVYRAKGIVRLKDVEYPVYVHYVFGEYELGEPVPDYGGESFLVIIGKDEGRVSLQI